MVIIPLGRRARVQYFEAVREGRRRASSSQMKMFEAAGFGMITLTTKKSGGSFEPVGEEEFAAVVESADGHVAIITDADGHTKAQSRAGTREEADAILAKLTAAGMERYGGGSIQIWTETRPVVSGPE